MTKQRRANEGRVSKKREAIRESEQPNAAEVTGLDLGGSWDDHVENTREAIAKLDRLTVEAEAQATRIIITNAR